MTSSGQNRTIVVSLDEAQAVEGEDEAAGHEADAENEPWRDAEGGGDVVGCHGRVPPSLPNIRRRWASRHPKIGESTGAVGG